VFDAENYVLRMSGSREVEVELFDKVVVRISDVKEESTGKRKVKLELVMSDEK
jgi:exosome complex exonuclease DIS3/RRP44